MKTDIQPMEASKKYNNYFVGSDFALIEGAGHFPFYTQPEKFAQIVGECLAKTNLEK